MSGIDYRVVEDILSDSKTIIYLPAEEQPRAEIETQKWLFRLQRSCDFAGETAKD